MSGTARKRQLANFGIVWTSQTTAAILIFAIPALGPLLAIRLALTPAEIGELVAITFVGIVSVSVFFGAIADYLGVRKILFLGHLVEAVSIMGAAFAHNFAGLAVAVLGIGFGYSSITPVTSKAIITWFSKEERGSVMGLKQTGTTVGASIAGALLPVVGLRYGLSASFLSAALLVLIGSAFLLGYKEPLPSTVIRKGFPFLREGLRVSINNRNLLSLGAVGFFYATVQGAVTTYIALFAQNFLGYDPVVAGLFLSLVTVSGTIGRPAFGLLSDRLLGGNRVLDLFVIAITASVMMVILSFTHREENFLLELLVVALLGFGALGWNGVFLALAGEYSNSGYEAVGTSLAFSLAMIGQAIGAPLFGILIEKTGGFTIPWQIFGLFLLAAAVLFTLAKSRKSKTDDETSAVARSSGGKQRTRSKRS